MHASLCCFCLPLLPPSLHLPTINFCVLHWSIWWVSVPISYHSLCLAFIWL
jgi:hypothetical protein